MKTAIFNAQQEERKRFQIQSQQAQTTGSFIPAITTTSVPLDSASASLDSNSSGSDDDSSLDSSVDSDVENAENDDNSSYRNLTPIDTSIPSRLLDGGCYKVPRWPRYRGYVPPPQDSYFWQPPIYASYVPKRVKEYMQVILQQTQEEGNHVEKEAELIFYSIFLPNNNSNSNFFFNKYNN